MGHWLKFDLSIPVLENTSDSDPGATLSLISEYEYRMLQCCCYISRKFLSTSLIIFSFVIFFVIRWLNFELLHSITRVFLTGGYLSQVAWCILEVNLHAVLRVEWVPLGTASCHTLLAAVGEWRDEELVIRGILLSG
ncbi:uncharacterized protein BT62DRAFT_923394 [Guyanagaster necrorhizus]|uniref:Uncharacterized protein n=1 Tax=Guyanagaster necrorhizus TaxID=856835 RepID=A0A9P7VIR8_9AGAR|nr:uncharacterized protein BT62DRAFT_923394 [Guyanagaster necrorhizus MCA 3950]KAG7441295.1 hypothetical protein BT62DRAFT_923394 [Guyanagaster necrorhizus MCA 3950]